MIFYMNLLFGYFANFILWLGILLTIGPILVILFIWRLTTVVITKLFRHDLYSIIPNDTYFSVDSSENMPIVNAAQIWRVQGLIGVEEFREHFYKCFLETEDCRQRYKNFYCYLVRFGGYVFKKSVENIELQKHIYEHQLEPNANVDKFIAKFMFEDKFRKDSPLWEIVLLPLPLNCSREEYETVLLFKIHHCLADGYSFVHIVDKLTGNTSPYLVQDDKDSLFAKLKLTFQTPKTLLDYWRDVVTTKDILYPLKSRNPQWYIAFATVDLECVKKLRRQTKTHFATIMMSLMIGALRRLLLETKSHCEIPSHIWTANSLPWPNHPRNIMINHWSGGVFKVPLQCDNALIRLQEAEEFFRYFHEKMKMHKIVRRLIINFTWCIPSFLLRLGHSFDLSYFKYSNAFATLMLSNSKHFLLGKLVRNIYLPLGLKDSVPTSVLFGVSTSHSNQLDLSVAANSEIIMNQEAIDRMTQIYFKEELEELIKLCNISSLEHNQSNNNYTIALE